MLNLLLTCLVLSTPLQIQPEFGKFQELAGKRRIFVITEDLEARKAIVKQIEEYIQKRKIQAQIVDSSNDAEIAVFYGSGLTRTTYQDSQHVGELAVAVRGAPVPNTETEPGGQKHQPRVVYSTQSSRAFSRGITFQRSPHKKAIRKFLDQWAKFQKTEPSPSTP